VPARAAAALRLLTASGNSLCVAESCTGGMLAAAITAVPGASAVFCGGVIAYANQVKHALLGVPDEVLAQQGAVSEACVVAMAQGACRLTGATCALAVSGIAGPGGGTPLKPVGLVWIGLRVRSRASAFAHRFRGSRARVRQQAVAAALRHLCQALAS